MWKVRISTPYTIHDLEHMEKMMKPLIDTVWLRYEQIKREMWIRLIGEVMEANFQYDFTIRYYFPDAFSHILVAKLEKLEQMMENMTHLM